MKKAIDGPKLIDLLQKFHSCEKAKARTHSPDFESLYKKGELIPDLNVISDFSRQLLDYEEPLISIVIPCYNEENEIIPTVLTFLYAIYDANVPTEIIAVDNNSSDRTLELLNNCGIKVVSCEIPGLRFARSAGFEVCNPKSTYIWLIDADTRAYPPLKDKKSIHSAPNPLKVSFKYMEENKGCIATSTGIVFEYQVPLRKLIKSLRLLIKGGNSFSCWAGANQFIRRKHLVAIGGIDLDVDGGEDHHRIFQLIRYAKKRKGLFLKGADKSYDLFAPVFTSDRRNSTFIQIIRNIKQQFLMPKLSKDKYGLPIHPKGTRHKDLYRRERGQKE
jgi:glycosyltransferase involved in cell wall biosynthesis